MTHEDCLHDGSARSVAATEVRGWRLILAKLNDDESAEADVFAEFGACPDCLYGLLQQALGVANGRRRHEPDAVQKAELLLARAIAKRDAL